MFDLNFNETTQSVFDQFYFYTKQGSRNELVSIIPQGMQLPIYLRRSTSDIDNFIQIFLRGEYNFLPFDPKTIIDLGGYIGLSSIFLSHKYPNSKILLVEPDFDNFILASLNCRGFPNIKCLNVGVWSKNCNLTVKEKIDGDWGTVFEEVAEEYTDQNSSFVKSMCVRSLIEYSNFDFIDFLKIDIEGSEKIIFKDPDALNWVDKCKVISCELHDHIVPGCSESVNEVMKTKKFHHNKYGEFDYYISHEV
jgi:FkbM family methyltransferase